MLLLEKPKNLTFNTQVDEQIREMVMPLLYNEGEGKMIPITRIVRLRNKVLIDNNHNLTKLIKLFNYHLFRIDQQANNFRRPKKKLMVTTSL